MDLFPQETADLFSCVLSLIVVLIYMFLAPTNGQMVLWLHVLLVETNS